jgi:branched-chain amino acid transport system ATP-binding protein
MLRVRDLRKLFGGVRAVDGVSFELASGEIRALIGPNGAGKTTCFNMLTGQLSPDAGDVWLGDERISGLPPHRIWRRGVSRTFQITATFATLTVLENVQVPRLSHARRSFRLFTPARRLEVERARGLLAQVGLGDQAARAAGVLAYGDLKKLELAIALASDPALLLLDEPTAHLDAENAERLLDELDALVAEGRALVLATHDPRVVARFPTATSVTMVDGRVVAPASVPEPS